jgi:hypothetical protein
MKAIVTLASLLVLAACGGAMTPKEDLTRRQAAERIVGPALCRKDEQCWPDSYPGYNKCLTDIIATNESDEILPCDVEELRACLVGYAEAPCEQSGLAWFHAHTCQKCE